MEWVEIKIEDVLAHMPTDVKARYQTWLTANPDRTGRLQQIMENTLREFRDNLKSVPENIVDPRETWVPQSAVRHLETIIVFSLGMEMGLPIDSAALGARYSADIFLRQILMGRYKATTESAGTPSPRYSIPERDAISGRALPILLALFVFVQQALGGWIRPDDSIYDSSLLVTFVPSAYSITASTLYGHLYGINAKLATTIAVETRTNISLTGDFFIQPHDVLEEEEEGEGGKLWQSHSLSFVTHYQSAPGIFTTNTLHAGNSATDIMGMGTTRSNLYWNGEKVLVEADIAAETDPVWQSEKSAYATGTPVYAETDPAIQSFVSISANRISSQGGNGEALTISGQDNDGPPPGGSLYLLGGNNAADGEGGEVHIEAGTGYNGEKTIYLHSPTDLSGNQLGAVSSIRFTDGTVLTSSFCQVSAGTLAPFHGTFNPASTAGAPYYFDTHGELAPQSGNNSSLRGFIVPQNYRITGASLTRRVGGTYGVSNAAPVAIMLYNKTLDQYANLFPDVGYGADFPPPMATNGLDIMLWASNEYSVAMARVAWTTAPTSVRNVVILYIDKE